VQQLAVAGETARYLKRIGSQIEDAPDALRHLHQGLTARQFDFHQYLARLNSMADLDRACHALNFDDSPISVGFNGLDPGDGAPRQKGE
jgi:hypothetical protein